MKSLLFKGAIALSFILVPVFYASAQDAEGSIGEFLNLPSNEEMQKHQDSNSDDDPVDNEETSENRYTLNGLNDSQTISDPWRYLRSFGKKILLGGVFFGVSSYLTINYVYNFDTNKDEQLYGWFFVLAMPFMPAIGIYLAGCWESEQGTFLSAMAGTYGGFFTALVINSFLLFPGGDYDMTAVAITTGLGAVIGGIIGYHISDSRSRRALQSNSLLYLDEGTFSFGFPDISIKKNKSTDDTIYYCKLFSYSY